ncbi:MAG: 2-oxoacid:acceptor oxidoreductase subunit alpha [SAR324 cluster bacterium]|nr:2-oxoacid:acceptor oxidoreductase subunit alpha [SAR324 cluster bacterium]
MSIKYQNLQGNHACALGAIAAGCRFFAGYPITPSSEIAERMSLELPKHEGVFIQMEDEIASMGAILGASMGGVKAMTATSGPGFSLKQENIGYAAGAEIPCVIANVMRGGPSTGMPTRPAQSDLMQARWGSHGGHPLIVITPGSVREIFDETVRAFQLSEKIRTPVIVLYDEVLGHLVETLPLSGAAHKITERKWADESPETFMPYAETTDLIPPMPRPGDGYRTHTTGLTHAEDGFPTQNPETVVKAMKRMLDKFELHQSEIESYETVCCEDAEVLVMTVGISARAAKHAVKTARQEGIKAGLFRPITLWPFPEKAFKKIISKVKTVVVPEMNTGQLSLEMERLCPKKTKIKSINRIDGEAIAPKEILSLLQSVAKK